VAKQCALPLPSAPLLLACGALAKDGRLTPHWIVFTGVAACLIADNVWFMLGQRRGAKVLRFICCVALEPDSCVRQTETAYVRYGSRSLLVAKFVPGLNTVSAPLAARSGVSFGRFVLFDTPGALIWIGAFAGLGYIFSDEIDRVGDYAARMVPGWRCWPWDCWPPGSVGNSCSASASCENWRWRASLRMI
jgi:membrane protein DedA with SNARE-associated domain